MKPNEIQIGDLLYYKGQFNAFPFKVESITKKKVGYHAEPNDHRIYYLRLSECKPIPLTPEILEKNGWRKDTYSNESYDNEDIECLSLWVGEDGKNKWWWHVGYELVTPINYVHQLQHALRLCGIKKEVEL